jgi:tetratricopeptide (TPR) repeat protein
MIHRNPLRLLLAVLLGLALASAPARAADPEYQNSMRLVNRYMAQAQYETASQLLEQILAKHPRDVPASASYVDALLYQHRLDDAETFLGRALEQSPGHADLYRMRVKLRRAQERPDDAFADVLLVVKTNPERATWAYRETVDLLKAGLDPARARNAIVAASPGGNGAPDFSLFIAVIAAQEGRGDEALRLVSGYDAEKKQSGEAIRHFADEMFALDRRDLARKAIATAVERAPTPERRTDHLFRAAEMAERDGNYKDALASLERIAAEREGKAAAANARLHSAEIHDKYLKDPAGALALYGQIRDDPSLGHLRPTLLLQMADCYVRLARFDEAVRTYVEVGPEAFDPEHAELAALRLADIEFFRGTPDSALTLYQSMADTYPRSRFTDQAAARYILLNKYVQVRMAGELARTWGRLEWARLAGDSSAVAAAADSLLDRDPEGELAAEALFALAETAQGGGNPAGAAARLEEIVRRFSGDKHRAPEALLRLGTLLADVLARPAEALTRFEAVLTDYPASVQAGDARRRVEALRRELRS